MLNIGPYCIESPALLAPMAGVTDAPFRDLCLTHGAGLATSEMITSDTSLWASEKSRLRLAQPQEQTNISSIQIAGSEPAMLAAAAVMAVEHGAQIVDINMGCPAKKVCKKLAGSALLKDEKLVADILSRVVSSVDVPVTLKTRTGWDSDNKNGLRIARIAQDEGIAAIAVHGRTRACRFAGNAEYDTIARIAQTVDIPVIANGDIDSPQKAKHVIERTGVSAVLIGRAAYGNPWIFEQTKHFLQHGEIVKKPSSEELIQTVIKHFSALYKLYGELKGLRIARKHFSWYCQQHLEHYGDTIKSFNKIESSQLQIDVVKSVFERHNLYEEKVA